MRITLAISIGLLLAGCKRPPAPAGPPQAPVTRASGLITQVLKAGDGDEAKQGDKVSVHYVGTLRDGTPFDSSRDRDAPFSFWVGEQQVIAGWDEGILGMREGELRRLTIPPGLAYGSDAKPGIPANSTLLFDVELLDVR
ncbi:MAG: peptidylprolyl isomerase FKBP-type [Myxococcaceae bacterium]|nr:peptidylprolyl isomerase FKBP-type [Myxococcaceae bacterium]